MVQPKIEVKGKIQAPHIGLDRSNVPSVGQGKGAPFDRAWTDELFRRSTLNFLGLYLADLDPLPAPTTKDGVYDQKYTEPSGNHSNGWVKAFAELEAMGWGILFFYVGYSIRAGMYNTMPPYDIASRAKADAINQEQQRFVATPKIVMPDALAKERGVLHANHIKKILRRLPGVPQSGAVVYVDNEGGDYLQSNLAVYFHALFDELQNPGKDLFAVRPGLYGFDNIAFPLLQKRPDLFIWHIDETAPSGWRGTKKRPWTESPGRLVFQPEHFPITIAKLAGSQDTHMIPLGWQFLANEEVSAEGFIIPRKKKSVSPTLRRVDRWDLNTSLVRDPCYPEASPRLAVLGPLVVRGEYSKTGHRETAGSLLYRTALPDYPPLPDSVLAMAVRERGGGPDADVIAAEQVEPDAPLVLCASSPSSIAVTLFTILKSGRVGTARRTGAHKWTPVVPLATTSTPPPLRRLRGIAAVALSDTQTEVFYVSQSCELLWARSLAQDKWVAPEDAGHGMRIHPLSNIAVAYLESTRVDAFFLDIRGLLTNVSWDVAGPGKPWVKRVVPPLEVDADAPKLLLNTPIAAVTVTGKHTLVFTVGRDLRLYMTTLTKGKDVWTPLAPLEPLGGGLAKPSLFAHWRLATVATALNRVMVACIRNDGMPVIYLAALASESGIWFHDIGGHLVFSKEVKETGTPAERTARQKLPALARAKIEAEERAALGLNGVDEDVATGWSVNPYGDVTLAMEGDKVTLYCVGTAAPGRTGILRRTVRPPGKDWVLVTGGELSPWPAADDARDD